MKYAVNSFFAEEEQYLCDFVEAPTKADAIQIVEKARPYAVIDDCALDAQDILDLAERLESAEDLPTTALELALSIDDAGHLCRKCGEPNDDGEGWDGMCGNCADRAEKGESDAEKSE